MSKLFLPAFFERVRAAIGVAPGFTRERGITYLKANKIRATRTARGIKVEICVDGEAVVAYEGVDVGIGCAVEVTNVDVRLALTIDPITP